MKKEAAKFLEDYNLAFEGTRRSSQLRGSPGDCVPGVVFWCQGCQGGNTNIVLNKLLVCVLTCLVAL